MDLTRLELAKDVSGRSHWLGERVLCVGLLGILPAAVVAPGMTMDMTIAVAFQVHNHMYVPSTSATCTLGTSLGTFFLKRCCPWVANGLPRFPWPHPARVLP